MSTPLYNGGLVGAIETTGRPYIADDGNWSMQGTSEVPIWRALILYVNGQETFGYKPAAQREPFAQAVARPGVFERPALLEWRGPILAPGQTAEMILTGGNQYLGWGDTAGEDWMEWGSLNPVTLQPVVATTGLLTVPDDTPPPEPEPGPQPPPVDDTIAELSEMVENVEVEMALATATNPEKWIEDNPGEAGDILRLVVYRAHNKPFEAKQLKTHRGRAASGIAQNGVLCQDEL